MPVRTVITLRGNTENFEGRNFDEIEDILRAVGQFEHPDEILVDAAQARLTKDVVNWWVHCVDRYVGVGVRIQYLYSEFSRDVAFLPKGSYKHPNSHFDLGPHVPEKDKRLHHIPEEYPGDGEDF